MSSGQPFHVVHAAWLAAECWASGDESSADSLAATAFRIAEELRAQGRGAEVEKAARFDFPAFGEADLRAPAWYFEGEARAS